MSKILFSGGDNYTYINCAGKTYLILSVRAELTTYVYPAKKKFGTYQQASAEPVETFRFANGVEQERFHSELCEYAERWIHTTPLEYFIKKYCNK